MPESTDSMLKFNYTSGQLLSAVASTEADYAFGDELKVYISGLPVRIKDMAVADWQCRVHYSYYGGRTTVAFYSPDGRSTVTFRIPGKSIPDHPVQIPLPELLIMLIEPMQGKMNCEPRPASMRPPTDLEILENLHKRIRDRFRRPQRRAMDKQSVETVELIPVADDIPEIPETTKRALRLTAAA